MTLLSKHRAVGLQQQLQHSEDGDLNRRRAIVGVSFVGMAAMGAVSALQTGLVKHLPDPPARGFDSDKVNSSETAYALGIPDGTLSLLGFAANVPLAAWGGADRARKQPWIPMIAAGKALVEAVAAAWYFYQMPSKEKAWCAYCMTGAAVSFAVAALTLSEARTACRNI